MSKLQDNRHLEDLVRSLTADNRRLKAALASTDHEDSYKSTRRLQSILENAPLCIHEIDLDGAFRSMNPTGVTMMARTAESSVIGVKYLSVVCDTERPRIATLMDAAFAGVSSEFQFVGAGTGPTRTFASNFVPIFDEVGKVERLMGCSREITLQLANEAARGDLERQVLHVQKLESLGLLAGGVAHDFNNVLAAIMGNLDVVRILVGHDTRVNPIIDEARQAVDHGARLCRQLLAYAGRGRFQLTAISLASSVQSVASMLQCIIPPTTRLDVALLDDDVRVEASSAQLDQIILNLVLNGSDALAGQGGKVSISVSKVAIGQAMFDAQVGGVPRAGMYGVISVRDNGKGIPAHIVDRIFDPFFSTKETGQGLGLAAVAGAVRAHGGYLLVESDVNGACFHVYLHATEKAVAKVPAQQPMRSRGQLLLVVDDDERVRNALVLMLGASGFQTVSAGNGADALALFRNQAPQISAVVLDVSMPDMSGPEVRDKLRAISPIVPIVLCSGWGREELAIGRDEITEFVAKPCSVDTMLEALGRILLVKPGE